MSGKLPWMKFCPGDFVQDTVTLSLPATGAWIKILCAMWRKSERGKLTLSIPEYCRLLGAPEAETVAVINELCKSGVSDTVTDANKNVTLVCRRMNREHKNHLNNALRQQRFRVTHDSNALVTGEKSEVRSQKSEEEKKKSASPAKPPATPRPRFSKPTPAAVTEYAASIGYKLDGQSFVDSYEAKGWLIGKTPMKDWKAAVRTWKSRDSQTGTPTPRKPEGPTPQDRRNAHSRAVREIVAAGRTAREAASTPGDWERWRDGAWDKWHDNKPALREALDILAGDGMSLTAPVAAKEAT
jgi:hypothetical protein